MKKLISLLAFIFLFINLYAQTDREFWFVAPEVTWQHDDGRFYPEWGTTYHGGEPILLRVVTRTLPANVTIEQPANTVNFPTINLSIPANSTQTVNLTDLGLQTQVENTYDNADGIMNKGIHIYSDVDISVYYEVRTRNNPDIFALKGQNGLGSDFHLPFQSIGRNQKNSWTVKGYSAIDIVAIEDNTVITITPSKPVLRNMTTDMVHPAGVPFDVTLNKGQTYSLPPAWDAGDGSGWFGREKNDHIGGTSIHVQGGKKVAVTINDDSVREDLASVNWGCYDLIGDQWVHDGVLGKEYIAMRGQLNTDLENIFITALEDGTRIWTEGKDTTANLPDGTIDEGQQFMYTFDGTSPDFLHIIANKKVSVLHVSGFGCEMGGAVLPPTDKCTGSTQVGITRSTDEGFYLNIMVWNGAEDGFEINGVPQDVNGGNIPAGVLFGPGDFQPVTGTSDWLVFRSGNIADGGTFCDVGTQTLITNNKDVFHLGVINGGSSSGCRFGYFSDFNELAVSAEATGSQSSAIRACSYEQIQLYADGGTNFNWWPAEYLNDPSLKEPIADPPPGTTTLFEVEVSGACGLTDTANVTVKKFPNLDAQFSVDKGNGCSPLQIEMHETSTQIYERYWDFNFSNIGGILDRDTILYTDFTNYDTDTTFTHWFINTTNEADPDSIENYNIRLLVKNTNDCVDTAYGSIIVYPEVTADFTISDLNDTIGCTPHTVSFIDNSNNEDFYYWKFGDGVSSTTQNPTHTFTNILNSNTVYTTQLIARSDYFCRDSLNMDITIFPYLEAGFTIDNYEGCSPLDVEINTNTVFEDSVELFFGDGQVLRAGSLGTVVHTYSNTGANVDTNTIELHVYNDEGCEKIWYDTVVVYPEVRANYNIDGNNYEGCNSRTVTFENTSNNGTYTASRYLWDFDDGTNMDTTYVDIDKYYNNTTTQDQTYDFRLTARSIFGCTDDTTNSIDIYRAYANFAVDNNAGCSPLQVKVTNNSIGDDIPLVGGYSWDYGDGHTDNVKNPFPYTYRNKTAADVTRPLILQVTGTNGCSTSKTINILVHPEIKAEYAISETTPASCDSLRVVFSTDIEHPSLTGVIYDWDFGDGVSAAIQDPTHVYKNLASSSVLNRVVDLHVETQYGCAYDTSSFIDVYPMVNAKFAVDKVAGCSPLSVNAVATEYIGIDEYNWDYGDTFTPNVSDPPLHTYPDNPPGSNDVYTLRLDVVDASGICTDFATKTITVYDEVNADFNPKNSTDCNPYTITFDNQSQNAVTYKWDFDDGGTTSTDFEPTYEFVNTTTGTIIFGVELEATSSEGCTDITTSNVNVLPYVVADFDVDVSEGCSPLTATIDNNSAGGTYRWYWNSSDGSGVADYTSANSNEIFNHIYTNTSGSDQIVYLTLIAENVSGCTDTTTVPITVYSEAKADFNPQGSISCNPYTVAFDNLSFNAATYLWNFNDGVTSNAFEPTHIFTNLTNSNKPYNVKLEVTSNRGCKHDTTATVSVYRYVNANFDINVSEGCSPLTVEISNNSAGGNYRWYWNSIDGSGAANKTSSSSNEVFNHTYNNSTGITEINTLMVIADNGNGCYDTLQRVITVYSSITASYSFVQNDACNPSDVIFTNTSVGGSTYTMNWDFDDGGTLTTTSNTVNKQFVNNTTNDQNFNVVLTAESENGCTDSYNDNITVYSKVVSDFSMDLSEGCPPFTATIENNSIGNASNTYQWLIDNVAVPTAPTDLSDFEHTYENTTTVLKPYDIKLIATNPHGCTSENTDIITAFEYVEASYSMDIDNGCTPLDIQFTDLSLVPSNTKYTWDFGDGASSGLSDPAHTFYNSSRTTDLSRTIKLTVQSANYCSDDTSMTIDIYHEPLAKFYIDKTSSCPPLQSTLTKLSEGEDMYEWRFGDGNTNTSDANLTYSWDNTDIDNIQYYNLELWVGTNHNCVDSTSLDLTVFPKVTADFTISDTAGCSPLENVQFTNTSTSPATQFFWTFGDGSYTNIENPLHDFANITSVDRVYDVYLQASSEYNCYDDTTQHITVYRQPDAEFYIDPTFMIYPENIVGITNKTNTGPFEYYWEFGDINLTTSTTEEPGQFEYEHWGEKVIELSVTSQTNPACFDNYSDTLIILPPNVNADFVTNIDAGCVNGGLEIEFTAAGSVYDENYQYDWDFGDGEKGSGQYATHIYKEPGAYYVKLTARSLEYDDLEELEEDYAYKTIYAYANPEVNFEVSPKLGMLDPVTLEARIKFYNLSNCNDTSGCAYTWEFGDGNTALSTDVTHGYEELGKFDVTLTAVSAHGCRDSLTFYEEVEIIGAGQIAFPNAFTPDGMGPSENETFRPLAEGVIEYELFIYNRWGELIFTTNDLSVGWDGTIDGERAKPDVYVWKAQGKFTNGKSFEIAGDVTLIR